MNIKNFLRPALWSGAILLIPFTINIFFGSGVDGNGFNWTLEDFAIIGLMLFVAGVFIELGVKIKDKTHKYYAVGTIVLLFLWLYVELAVGLFTKWGS
jgi:hypothetical protein